MDAGFFEKGDPEVLALEFFAPVFLLFYRYDSTPEGVSKARDLFMRHVRQVAQTHGPRNKVDVGEEFKK